MAESFEKYVTRNEVLMELSSKGVRKTCHRHFLTGTGSAEKLLKTKTFQMLWYLKQVSRFCVASDIVLRERKAEIAQARLKPLKHVER